MLNLYSQTRNVEAIRRLFRISHNRTTSIELSSDLYWLERQRPPREEPAEIPSIRNAEFNAPVELVQLFGRIFASVDSREGFVRAFRQRRCVRSSKSGRLNSFLWESR